ncbi:hypothetical protein [Niveibacterium sp. SC-1]|uniref:hypothetical protein n=1 Tax=Niveibacterium sp. SC-1 TaxID=3135646 RepID=UPI00311F9F79
MLANRLILTIALGALASSAFAQEQAVSRDVKQQDRIEAGLQSGALNTREASKLEKEESQVSHMEAKAMRNGSVSSAEAQRIDAAQNKVSQDIYREKHDAQRGDPNSASSQRMQAAVQRNANQQARIDQGLKSGELTTHEAARTERGQAHVDRREARAGSDGHMGARESERVQLAENHQSGRIFRQKHDRQHN